MGAGLHASPVQGVGFRVFGEAIPNGCVAMARRNGGVPLSWPYRLPSAMDIPYPTGWLPELDSTVHDRCLFAACWYVYE